VRCEATRLKTILHCNTKYGQNNSTRVACFFVAENRGAGINTFCSQVYTNSEMKGDGFVKKKKTTFDLIKTIRNEWSINPRTRVQENELKNKKKRRQNERKLVKEGMGR